MSVFIWCSWYYYPAWKGKFYPAWLPTSKWLAYYAEHFNTLEINSTFYKFPTSESLQKRYKTTPAWFRFTVKAPQLLTHRKKMKDVSEDLTLLYDAVESWLAEKAACILFQFPPSFIYTPENLARVLTVDAERITHVCEFRHISRYSQEVYDALQEAWIVFCNISHPDFTDTYISTTPIIYLRMHGKKELFKSAYGEEWLQDRIDKIKKEKWKDIFIYFNNTWFGEAIKDWKIMQTALEWKQQSNTQSSLF